MATQSVECSLKEVYVLISSAIAMLGTAIACAAVFFNVPGLIVAVTLVSSVAFVMIPQIRAKLESYAACRGPSKNCRVGPQIDLLGKVASSLSIVSWVAALALQISALGFITSVILAWLGVGAAAAGEALKVSGIVGASTAALLLGALLAQVRVYEACLDREAQPASGEHYV